MNEIILTGKQIKELKDFVCPDDKDEGQLEDEITIKDMGDSFFCWFTDYPEEGSIQLDKEYPTDLTKTLSELAFDYLSDHTVEVSLHTDLITEDDPQTKNEVNYLGYKRITLSRKAFQKYFKFDKNHNSLEIIKELHFPQVQRNVNHAKVITIGLGVHNRLFFNFQLTHPIGLVEGANFSFT